MVGCQTPRCDLTSDAYSLRTAKITTERTAEEAQQTVAEHSWLSQNDSMPQTMADAVPKFVEFISSNK
jgi:hypothetical protein